MLSRQLALVIAVGSTVALGACKHNAANSQLDRLTSNQADMAEGSEDGPGSQADLRRVAGSDRVFFALDSSLIDARSRDTLRRQAGWLANYPERRVTIEGHCDERGTREYNIALGGRRANAAKNILVSEGVAPERITVVSYGKERPEALGSDEQSYALNRRAVTMVVR